MAGKAYKPKVQKDQEFLPGEDLAAKPVVNVTDKQPCKKLTSAGSSSSSDGLGRQGRMKGKRCNSPSKEINDTLDCMHESVKWIDQQVEECLTFLSDALADKTRSQVRDCYGRIGLRAREWSRGPKGDSPSSAEDVGGVDTTCDGLLGMFFSAARKIQKVFEKRSAEVWQAIKDFMEDVLNELTEMRDRVLLLARRSLLEQHGLLYDCVNRLLPLGNEAGQSVGIRIRDEMELYRTLKEISPDFLHRNQEGLCTSTSLAELLKKSVGLKKIRACHLAAEQLAAVFREPRALRPAPQLPQVQQLIQSDQVPEEETEHEIINFATKSPID